MTEPIADRKVHFAPWERQMKTIEALLREGEYRNVTELMRLALDHYLAARGRPPLTEQARQMAEDFHATHVLLDGGLDDLQDASRATEEDW